MYVLCSYGNSWHCSRIFPCTVRNTDGNVEIKDEKTSAGKKTFTKPKMKTFKYFRLRN
jgi:hypothetical protein